MRRRIAAASRLELMDSSVVHHLDNTCLLTQVVTCVRTNPMKPSTQLPLAAYTRVSTAGQAASGIGLEAQRQTISDAAASGDFEVGAWHETPAARAPP